MINLEKATKVELNRIKEQLSLLEKFKMVIGNYTLYKLGVHDKNYNRRISVYYLVHKDRNSVFIKVVFSKGNLSNKEHTRRYSLSRKKARGRLLYHLYNGFKVKGLNVYNNVNSKIKRIS